MDGVSLATAGIKPGGSLGRNPRVPKSGKKSKIWKVFSQFSSEAL